MQKMVAGVYIIEVPTPIRGGTDSRYRFFLGTLSFFEKYGRLVGRSQLQQLNTFTPTLGAEY